MQFLLHSCCLEVQESKSVFLFTSSNLMPKFVDIELVYIIESDV